MKRAQLDIKYILNVLAQFSDWSKIYSYENLNPISLAKINRLFTTKHSRENTLKIPAHPLNS